VIEGRAHSTDLEILTRQAQLSPVRTGQNLGIDLTVEVVIANGTLPLAEIVLEAKTAPAASKNHMHEKRKGKRIPVISRVGERHQRWRTLEVKVKKITGGRLGNACVVSHVQFYPNRDRESMQKKYVKDQVEIHSIKQRDGETIEDFMERFKVETRRMKRAPKCMRISRFMHGVNNLELTKRLNEHVPKTMEEMMTAPLPSYEEKLPSLPKRKVTHRGNHGTSPSGMFQSRNLTSEVNQRKDGGLTGKLSHLIKEIKQGRDQLKVRKKEVPAKDKSTTIYMVQSWYKMTRQKVTQSFARVREITFPPPATSRGTEGPLIIEAEISGHMIHRMYVDGGSSIKELYEHCFNRLWPEIKSQMVPATTSLTDFSGKTIWPLGQLRLLIIIGDGEHSTKAWMNFIIVRSLSLYNVTIRSTILIPTECAVVTTTSKEILKEAEVYHKNFKVALHSNFLDQEVAIRGTLSVKGRTELCSLLKENSDIFAWQPSDMTGVPRSVAEDRLNIQEGYLIVRQKKRGQASERAGAIQVEDDSLVGHHPGGRHVYIRISLMRKEVQKKTSASCLISLRGCLFGRELKSFIYKLEYSSRSPKIFSRILYCMSIIFLLACRERCNQFTCDAILEGDYHSNGEFYWFNNTKIPFGLKNTGATYQRLVDKAFDSQVGQNIEVYVDDLVIKSHTETKMLKDINEMLRKINMKLNPKKYMFWAVEGMFLGYMIRLEGIKPCPDKTEAVLRLQSPRTIKEVQSLNRKLASLNRLLSKSAEKSLPLFKTLKKYINKSNFHWTPEAKQAFKQLKQHLSELPMLKPVYFVIHALQGPELNYTPMEKLVLALVSAAKRSGAGLILTSLEGTKFTYALRFQFTASNNEAEYEALIADLRIAAQMGVYNVHVSVDSKLVANQVLGKYVAKEERMIKYLKKAKSLVSCFANFSISQVPISKNKKEDALSKITSTSFAHLSKQVFINVLKEKSIQEKEVVTVVEEDGPTWITPIMEYLKEVTHPEDRKEASKLYIKARQYELLEGVLYRWSFLRLSLRCVGPPQAVYVIREIHEGSRSKTRGDNHRQSGKEVHVGQHSVPFGLLGEIVSDNGKQFSDNSFKDWCEKLDITQRFASAHRMMIKSSHSDTLFSLTYGTKAVIPVEIEMPTYRTTVVDTIHNDEELRLNLDLLEERRERTAIREANAKLKMTKYYNARVRSVTFRPRDFVYRSNDASHVVDGGKLGPKWEGPYKVTKALRDGAYRLRSMDGMALLRM
nr:hypothetical protein [Tanacetum cinerariifolium]